MASAVVMAARDVFAQAPCSMPTFGRDMVNGTESKIGQPAVRAAEA
jgi:hypothetical protein